MITVSAVGLIAVEGIVAFLFGFALGRTVAYEKIFNMVHDALKGIPDELVRDVR